MNHDSYSDDTIRDILATVKTIAMVGASGRAPTPPDGLCSVVLQHSGVGLATYAALC